jgi:membrane peptidoglycan carboxypeptidase
MSVLGHLLRRVTYAATVLALSLMLTAAAALTVAWPLAPSVAGTAALVAQRIAAFHQPLLTALPEPDRLGRALIATEDSNFYTDPGVDPVGIARAVLHPFRGGSDPGGATLTQQLAKVLYTPEQADPAALAEQLVLALKLDARYSKARILTFYEAAVYFGHGFYGLPAAAAGYFAATPAQLTWGQASMLAGLVQAPSAFDPLLHLAAARRRQREVLDRLVATGTLSPAQAAAAYAAPLGLRA